MGAVLGHRDIRTTQRYAHLAPDAVRRIASETDALYKSRHDGRHAFLGIDQKGEQYQLRVRQDSNLRPTAPERHKNPRFQRDCATLNESNGESLGTAIHGDLPSADLMRHQSSREAADGASAGTANAESLQPADARTSDVPATVDEALRLAIKLAVDAGHYGRAAALLDVARRTEPRPASVTALAAARERGKP